MFSGDLHHMMNYVLERMAKGVRMYLGGVCVFSKECDIGKFL